MKSHLARSRLVAVFLAALLLFNYPLLALFDDGRLVAGWNVGFLYLFGAWALVIAMLAWIVERGGR